MTTPRPTSTTASTSLPAAAGAECETGETGSPAFTASAAARAKPGAMQPAEGSGNEHPLETASLLQFPPGLGGAPGHPGAAPARLGRGEGAHAWHLPAHQPAGRTEPP